MRVSVAVLAIALIPAGRSPAEVRVGSDSVRVHSVGQPLSEILSQLSKAASFQLRYDGPAPSVRIYATIEGRSVSETVSRLLEGTGVTWGARFDARGTSIELLVIGGPIQASPAVPSRSGRASLRPPIEAPPPEPMEEDEPPMMEPDPEPEAPPEAPKPSAASPGLPGSPSPSIPSGTAWPGGFGSSLPRYESPTGAGVGSSHPNMPMLQPPQLPRGASMP